MLLPLPTRQIRLFGALLTLSMPCALIAAEGVEITPQKDRVTIRVDGELLTELRWADAPKPYFYPVLGPHNVAVTRHFPMHRDRPDEEKDHPHQRSIWFTHGDVNGVDFWAEGAGKGRVVHKEILEAQGGPQMGVLRTANDWVAADGKVLLTDETTLTVHRHHGARMFDLAMTLKGPADHDVTFGDTKEGTMGIRLAESMRLKPNQAYKGKPTGHILQDTGARDGATWGKRAVWTAYTGPVEEHLMTVAIIDHAENPRHPTWWHVRDYGLFAANPFGIHDFERKPAGAGDFVIKAGDSATFAYRFLLLAGEPDPAKLNQLAADFSK
jgi:hypothetical protein